MYLIKLYNGIIQSCQKIKSEEEAQWRFPKDFLKDCIYSESYLPIGYQYVNGRAIVVTPLNPESVSEEEETSNLEKVGE